MDATLGRVSVQCTDLLSNAMNKFLKKRPTDGPIANEDALHVLTRPSSPPGSKKSSASRWKKNKKPTEVKPQLDLSMALPSTDDFRTSLIMPSLSTRFSMLREQDDPSSLLGKASDDSVLQPRRRSRMMDFGFTAGGLSDIAEVSSIHGSIRPPFAESSRGQSFASEDGGYGSEADLSPSGGVMSRARPGEGNILFGGRQKVYKIPTSGANSSRSQGRLVYEDDVGMSAFQKYRQRQRQMDETDLPRASDDHSGFDFGLGQTDVSNQHEEAGLDNLPNDSAKDLTHSPSLSSYDKKRSTTSSTARSDARSSTAATSIASQTTTSAQPSPAQAPATTITTTLTISNSISTAPPMSAPLPDRSNNKTRRLYEHGLDQHMQEQQSSAMTRLNSIQRQRALSGKKSPPLLHGAKSASNLQDRPSQPVFALGNQSPPPQDPSTLPALNTVNSGKYAAASNSSSPVVSHPHSPADMEEIDMLNQALEPADRGKATALGAFNKPAQAFDEKQYLERQQSLQRSISSAAVRKKAAPQVPVQHRAEPANANSRKHEPTGGYTLSQRAVNQLPAKPHASPQPAKATLPDTHRTFFGNISASEDEDDEDEARSFSQPQSGQGNYSSRWQPTPLQPVSEHPALRSQKSTGNVRKQALDILPPHLRPPGFSHPSGKENLESGEMDSPTLPRQAQPLNGMVHHLRQRSNQSSIYAMDEQVSQDDTSEGPEVSWRSQKSDSFSHVLGGGIDDQSACDSTYATSNPWDLDEQTFISRPGMSRDSISLVDEAPSANIPSSRQSEISVIALENAPKTGSSLAREATRVAVSPENPLSQWQQELGKQHTREASTSTQQDREAFDNDLAARRNAIQESIKSIVERDTHSRGTSPAPSASGPLRALGMLRSKTSRESMAHMHEQSSRNTKFFGTANGNSSSTSLPGPGERAGHSFDMPPLPTAQHPAFKPDGPGPSRSRAPSASRSRSTSNATTGRSRSRTGPYRDDLEKAMVEGRGSSAAAYTPDPSPFPEGSPELSRHSDDDKNAMANYFDQKSRHAANGGGSTSALARNARTPGRSGQVSSYSSQDATAPQSSSSPTIGQQPYSPIIPSSGRPGGMLRKKTISKHEISEPRLVSSTSNVDTVDLPEGASLKNGMDEPPPIPPINPRRRTTRRIFGSGRDRSNSRPSADLDPSKAAISEPMPTNDLHFAPNSAVRLPYVPSVAGASSRTSEKSRRSSTSSSPAMQQPYKFDSASSSSPEQVPPAAAAALQQQQQHPVTAPVNGGMF